MAFADTTNNTVAAPRSLGAVIARPFVGFLNFLIALGESGSRIEAVRRLNAQTDADLAAKGTTRAAEVSRIFAPYMYL